MRSSGAAASLHPGQDRAGARGEGERGRDPLADGPGGETEVYFMRRFLFLFSTSLHLHINQHRLRRHRIGRGDREGGGQVAL